MKKALVPGSFDPITLGHIAIIESAARLFDCVTVCVMVNEEKKYMLSLEERAELIEKAVSHLENVKVDTWSGWLFEYAEKNGIDVIVKGIRCEKDTAFEILQADFNRDKYPAAQTVLIPAPEGMGEVSSTLVREKALQGEDLSSLVPENVAIKIKNKIKGDN
jgi:pantetheine-phosphate adenylyltransferase